MLVARPLLLLLVCLGWACGAFVPQRPFVTPQRLLPRSPTALRASQRQLEQLENQAAYDSAIESAREDDKVVVIKFHASWCRACKAMSPKYQRVAEVHTRARGAHIQTRARARTCSGLSRPSSMSRSQLYRAIKIIMLKQDEADRLGVLVVAQDELGRAQSLRNQVEQRRQLRPQAPQLPHQCQT